MKINDYKENVFAELANISLKYKLDLSDVFCLFAEVDELPEEFTLIIEYTNKYFIWWRYRGDDVAEVDELELYDTETKEAFVLQRFADKYSLFDINDYIDRKQLQRSLFN